MKFTDKVLESLREQPRLSIAQVAEIAGTSVGYARNQLTNMEITGAIERVDDRTPIIYQINAKSPAIQYKEAIASAKVTLLAAVSDKDGFIPAYLKKYPRSKWEPAIKNLTVYAEALKELNAEGKLIDTL